MNHLDQLRRRLEWSYLPPVFGAELPSEAPVKARPPLPPIDQPATVRAALAAWWYTVAFHRGGWDATAQAAWRQISELRIQYYGPAGWESQPGWLDLAQRAEIVLQKLHIAPELIQAFKGEVDGWIQQWDQEWDQAGYRRRLDIGQAWQAAYREGLKTDIKEEIKQRLPDSSFEFGAGAALMLIGATLIGGAILFPDVARTQAIDTAGRYRRLMGR